MTENSPLIGPRREAENLRSASAADGDSSARRLGRERIRKARVKGEA